MELTHHPPAYQRRIGSSCQQTQHQSARGCGEAHSSCTWKEGQQSPCRAACQLHTKQPSGQLRDLCDFSWMRTSGKESPWKGLTEAFIRSIHQPQYFKTGFLVCTSPDFIRIKLLVDNYWQRCTLLNTLTGVTQSVCASDAGNAVYTQSSVYISNLPITWQIHNIHCTIHGSPSHATQAFLPLKLLLGEHFEHACPRQLSLQSRQVQCTFSAYNPPPACSLYRNPTIYKVDRISAYYSSLTTEQI